MVASILAFISKRIQGWKNLSLASYVSMATGCMLLFLTLVTWALFDSEPQRVAWSDYVQLEQVLGLLVIGIAICVLAYWTVRIWCENLPARENEMHRAWEAGIQALRHRGANISDKPIYLMLGCHDSNLQKNFLQKAGFKLAMDPVPADPSAPIRWFIGDHCLVLGFSSPGIFGTTQSRIALHRIPKDRVRSVMTPCEQVSQLRDQTSTCAEIESWSNVGLKSKSQARESGTVGHLTEKIVTQCSSGIGTSDGATATITRTEPCSKTVMESQAAKPETGEWNDYPVISQLNQAEDLLSELEVGSKHSMSNLRLEPKQESDDVLTSTEIVRHQALLADVCRRLSVSRSGAASINGAIAWIDASQLCECVTHARQLGHSLNRDLLVLREELGMVAPMTLVMDRMEQLPGMVELIRRAGPQTSSSLLLGCAYDVHEIPGVNSMNTLCQQSIDSIRRSVYDCFQSSSGANHVGNRKLFQLLLSCRGHLHHAVQILSRHAITNTNGTSNDADSPMINGIFFSASGDKPTEHAYCQPIFNRLLHQQDLLRWTGLHCRLENRYQVAVWAMRIACCILALMAAIQITLKFWA